MSEKRDIVERLRAWRDRYGIDIAGPETPGMCEEAAAEIARLREERRWVPVGERLPDVGETLSNHWFDVAGKWGTGIAWYTGSGWQDPQGFGVEVTHFRKRTLGPDVEKPELPTG